MKEAPARLLAEFTGVFFLCFFGIGAINNTQGGDLLGIALAHGIAIFVAIAAFAHVSGAHFNPAVTVAVVASKRLPVIDGVAYILAQLLGGAVAAVVAKYAFGALTGIPALGDGVTVSKGLVIEAITTFILMITIMGVAVDSRGTFSIVAGLPIGLAITGDILFAGPVTGAAMNPARWFGPALVNGSLANGIVWIVGPIVGALVAVFLYDAVVKPARG